MISMAMMINIQKATYIDAEIEAYKGHPLINALPAINSREAAFKILKKSPKIPDIEKSLPPHLKRQAMMKILDDFLHPTKAHHQLEQVISGMIRRGYLSRNIADKSYQENLNRVNSDVVLKPIRNAGSKALASSVIGCSGTGKSTAVEAILASYPQALYHEEFQHVQLVWLKVECPHNGSERSLCINFFRAVDKVLGTDYHELYVKPKNSAETMLGDIARVCAIHSVGLLVLDEIQHLEKSSATSATKLMNFFVTLNNVIDVSLLYIGTPKAIEIFGSSLRSARRSSQFGSIMWNRFSYKQETESDSVSEVTEWQRFFKRLWKLQWFSTPTPYTESMEKLFWELTQGIAHVAVTLFYLSQVRIINAGEDYIDYEAVLEVFDEELSMIHPMINELKSNRPGKILKFDDIEIPKDVVHVYALDDEVYEEYEESLNEDESALSKLDQLINFLETAGLDSVLAKPLAAQAISENPGDDLLSLAAHIKDLQEPKTTTKKKNNKISPVFIEKDLRLFLRENASETYLALKNEGIVIDINRYI